MYLLLLLKDLLTFLLQFLQKWDAWVRFQKRIGSVRVLVGSRWSWLLRKWDWICARQHRGRFGTKTPMHRSYKNKRKVQELTRSNEAIQPCKSAKSQYSVGRFHECFKRHTVPPAAGPGAEAHPWGHHGVGAPWEQVFHAGFWLTFFETISVGAIHGGSRAAVAKLEFLNSISDETLHWDVTELQRNATQL